MSQDNLNHPVMIRLTAQVRAEVRRIAERESESQSTILRRLIKNGLQQLRSESPQGAA